VRTPGIADLFVAVIGNANEAPKTGSVQSQYEGVAR
jgi:hypothetical protein